MLWRCNCMLVLPNCEEHEIERHSIASKIDDFAEELLNI